MKPARIRAQPVQGRRTKVKMNDDQLYGRTPRGVFGEIYRVSLCAKLKHSINKPPPTNSTDMKAKRGVRFSNQLRIARAPWSTNPAASNDVPICRPIGFELKIVTATALA